MIDLLLTAEQEKKLSSYLGLAQKAGKIAAGDTPVIEALKKNKAKAVFVANDTAAGVINELYNNSSDAQYFRWNTKSELGRIVGKSPRGCLAVLDEGFYQAILKIIE
ncbi:MAG: ribosomal L7Ae/L30e/S12e/Gadd45 family protein [Clostridia bacterium]|nr:ribosomal L7Ae/L30e/S12e/Gadd45 family protein [Clostridia bacterium]MDD4798061.1 ribosomal L7Ae/L30e/S12e/Gadd45 family protein [Clostridia bacterium]